MNGILCDRLKISIEICSAFKEDRLIVTVVKEDDPDIAIVLVGEDANKAVEMVTDLLKQMNED